MTNDELFKVGVCKANQVVHLGLETKIKVVEASRSQTGPTALHFLIVRQCCTNLWARDLLRPTERQCVVVE